ncbi:acetyl-CoA carboxylase biotin carboxylase subunit family protein [Pendulispora albinea]|uniref:ATP-grasp domain-containing protein n=1 Tax=Pendulispora albinea TaxID=2741071 RepID=A0ABZ2M186_9BACT
MNRDIRKLVIVESSCVGADYMGRAAIQAGYQPIYLSSKAGSQGDTRAQMQRYTCIECDTSSVETMASALAGVDGIEAAVSFCDTYIMNAVRLAQALSVRGQPAVLERLKDKWEVQQLILDYSPSTMAFEANAIPVDEIRQFVRTRGNVIVKGRRSSGGLGAKYLTKPAQADELPQFVQNAGIPNHLAPDLWLAQVAIQGDLVSLEGFVAQGEPTFLGFSGRKKVGMSEAMILFPWDDHVSHKAKARAREAVTALVRRAGLASGYFHVEFMMTHDDAFVIDANMGRIGGGGLGQQIALAHGITPVALHAHVLNLALEGDAPAPNFSRRSKKDTASIMYGIPVKARFHGVQKPAEFASMNTVILDEGELVPAMGSDNYAWIGIASGFRTDVENDVRSLRIETDRGEFAAAF